MNLKSDLILALKKVFIEEPQNLERYFQKFKQELEASQAFINIDSHVPSDKTSDSLIKQLIC